MAKKNIFKYKDNRIPYFYIIEHIRSKVKYAGAKWGKDSDPNNFMKDKGYQTSSKIVKDIIENEGLGSFKIIAVKTEFECKMHVYEYETRWLHDHQCAQSNEWFNRSNNHKNYHLFVKRTFTEKHIKELSERMSKWQLQEIKPGLNRASYNNMKMNEKFNKTIDPITGLNKNQLRALKTRDTKLSMIVDGRKYYDVIAEKISEVCNTVDDLTGMTMAQKRGKKISEKRLKEGTAKGERNPRYGVTLSKEQKDKISNSLKGRKPSKETLEKHRNKQRFKCPHCNKSATKGNFNRWHNDNCKLKPIQ